MAARQPKRDQTSQGSDVITNNNADQVVGILSIPINRMLPAGGGVLVLDPPLLNWYMVNPIPYSLLPADIATQGFVSSQSEIQFNYRFQGGF